MGIIFEGPDASGKSTAARKVSQASGRELYLAGGKPRDTAHRWQMIDEQLVHAKQGHVIDRVSSISEQIYREELFMDSALMGEALQLSIKHIIVYCRPPEQVLMDPSKHEWKDYDTEEWKANILARQAEYVKRYDLLMTRIPCVIYDWTCESSNHILNLLCEWTNPNVLQSLKDSIRQST